MRFHERRAASEKVAAIKTPLPKVIVPEKRRRKRAKVAVSETGVMAKA